MGAKDQGSRRTHPQHDKKAMPGSAAARSKVTVAKPPGKPSMYSGAGHQGGSRERGWSHQMARKESN